MANESEVFSRPNQEAKIHDFEQFTLWENTPDRPGYRSRLTFGERNGAARISVFPNYESGPKVLYVGMHPVVFLEWIRRFEAVIKGENGKKDFVKNLDRDPNAPRDADAEKVAKVVRNILHFGKGDDGVCWLGIEQGGIKNIRFKILSPIWHHFHKADGSQVSSEEGSAAQALALCEALRMAMAPYIARIRPPFEKNVSNGQKSKSPAGDSDPKKLTTFSDEDINY